MSATIAMTIVVAWLLFAVPWLGRQAFRKLLVALDSGDPEARVGSYKRVIWQNCFLVLIVLLVSKLCQWTEPQLGFVWPHLTGQIPMTVIYVATAAIFGIALLGLAARRRQVAQPGADAPRTRLAHSRRMLPQSPGERGWFVVLAIAVGIGEEIVWRGFGLCVLFACNLHGPATVLIAVLALAFGWAHLYQGVGGVIVTAILGAWFAALYLATGSLLVPIILHILFILRFLLARPEPGASWSLQGGGSR